MKIKTTLLMISILFIFANYASSKEKTIYYPKVEGKKILLKLDKKREQFAIVFKQEKEQSGYMKGYRYYVVTNKKKYGPYGSIGDRGFTIDKNALIFSPDGSRLAINVNNTHIFDKDLKGNDDKKYGLFGNVKNLRYTKDNKLFYLASVKENKIFFIGNKEIDKVSREASCYDVQLSDDGKTLAYRTILRIGKNKKTTRKTIAVVGGKRFLNYENIQNLVLSDDGSKYAFKASKKRGSYVVTEKGEAGPYYNIGVIKDKETGKISISYVKAVKGGKAVYINNKKASKAYPNIQSIAVTPDAKHFALIIKKNKQYFVVKEDKKYGPLAYVSNLKISNDGKNIAFLVKNKKSVHIAVNGVIAATSAPRQFIYTPNMFFAPSGKVLVSSVTANNKWMFVRSIIEDNGKPKVFGKPLLAFQSPPSRYAFSPDGKDIVYYANMTGPLYKGWYLMKNQNALENIYYKSMHYINDIEYSKRGGALFFANKTANIFIMDKTLLKFKKPYTNRDIKKFLGGLDENGFYYLYGSRLVTITE